MARYVGTAWRLGLVNCARVAVYRLLCRSGAMRILMPVGEPYVLSEVLQPVRHVPAPLGTSNAKQTLAKADRLFAGSVDFFGYRKTKVGYPPDWHRDADGVSKSADKLSHWSKVDEFAGGDIKLVWEPSRWEWALLLARAFRISGQIKYLTALGCWMDSWVHSNPVNEGPNWRCGQETSIRLMNFLTALWLLGVRELHGPAARFVFDHLRRVAATTFYAVAQDNNHATSEAAALLVGGIWLSHHHDPMFRSRGVRWVRKGRALLEERILKLVQEDGTFSQYSVNYHRMFLDTAVWAEWWCRQLGDPGLGKAALERVDLARSWLEALVEPETGDAANIGANDGARLMALSETDYRDYRPTVQTATTLLKGCPAYADGPWGDTCRWLGLDEGCRDDAATEGVARLYEDGGFAVLRAESSSSWGVIRFPVPRFRPSHADAFHLDLWSDGLNLTRDGGTYTYNSDSATLSYFAGTESHCTCQFDDLDQMPRIGRFLFSNWLDSHDVELQRREHGQELFWTGWFRTSNNVTHRRSVTLRHDVWEVVDEVSGQLRKVVLRWRLAPIGWRMDGNMIVSSAGSIEVAASAPIRRLQIVEGFESRYYLHKSPVEVLELEVGSRPVTIRSIFDLRQSA